MCYLVFNLLINARNPIKKQAVKLQQTLDRTARLCFKAILLNGA